MSTDPSLMISFCVLSAACMTLTSAVGRELDVMPVYTVAFSDFHFVHSKVFSTAERMSTANASKLAGSSRLPRMMEASNVTPCDK